MVLHGQLCGRVGRRRELILERPSFGRAVRFSVVSSRRRWPTRLSRSPLLPFLLALSLSLGAVAAGHCAAARAARDRRARGSRRLCKQAFASVADKVFPSLVCLTAFERLRRGRRSRSSFEQGGFNTAGAKRSRSIERYPSMRRLASATGFAMSADGYHPHHSRFPEEARRRTRRPDRRRGAGWNDLVLRGRGHRAHARSRRAQAGALSRPEPPQIEPVVIADQEAIRVGHWAIAVGDPLGPQRVFAAGLISARPERGRYQAELAATFLEASLQVHPEALRRSARRPRRRRDGHDRSATGRGLSIRRQAASSTPCR